MAGELKGVNLNGTMNLFVAYNVANQPWNTHASAFDPSWSDANYDSGYYGLTATQQGTSGNFIGDSPSSLATWYEMRQVIGGTPSTDPIVWEDPVGGAQPAGPVLLTPGTGTGEILLTNGQVTAANSGSSGYSGTAQGSGGGANTIQLASDASSLQNYVGQQIVISGTSPLIEVNVVVGYDAGTQVCTCANPWRNTISAATPYAFPGLLQPAITFELQENVIGPPPPT
jgi:hypothetical protein